MTCQQIHEHIWRRAIEAIRRGECLQDAKRDAVFELLGRIGAEAVGLLSDCSNCVLCAIYRHCDDCPLGMKLRCTAERSLYHYALDGDVSSAEKIKEVDVMSGVNPRYVEMLEGLRKN